MAKVERYGGLSEFRLRAMLTASVKAKLKNNEKLRKARRMIDKLRQELKDITKSLTVEQKVAGLRFINNPSRYYWGVMSYAPLRNFIKLHNVTSEQFRLLMLCNYHKFITTNDMVEWFISPKGWALKMCVKKELIRQERAGYGMRIVYIPTEKGRNLIDEYCKIIDKYVKAQLKLKKDLDYEKARPRRTKPRTA